MKQVFLKRGKVLIEDTPISDCDENHALVRVTHSVISVGTEVTTIHKSKQDTLLQRLGKQPSKALKVLEMVRDTGIATTVRSIKKMQQSVTNPPASTLGYSCSGVIVSVGANINDLRPGDHVACGGIGKAVHAEVAAVPRNLIVKVPEGVSLRDAASATIGSIAMQGVRRADVRLGEYVAVIGLGLIGQMTVQILNASGCRVIGIDLIKNKLKLADGFGVFRTVDASRVDPVKEVMIATADRGVDATIITAASDSDTIVQQAMEMTRKKGTVVVVGAVGLGLNRQPFYHKEIDFKISCSYGPGRYDESYEEKGQDYPYPYVRWTENRNMEAYLRLIADGKLGFSSLVSVERPVEEAAETYEMLKSPTNEHLGVILTYNYDSTKIEAPEQRRVDFEPKTISVGGRIRIGMIGAGGFAKGAHLPNLKSLPDLFEIKAVASRTGANATVVAKQFGAGYATTDYDQVINDPEIDMVIIATRHDSHAMLATKAAKAGKAILLEKPMALNQEELDELSAVLEETKVPFLVGFNRRFSPCALKAKEIVGKPVNPLMVLYRVNAGHIPIDHWVHGKEGGGRIIGEACHMIDFFSFLTESTLASVDVSAIDSRNESVAGGDNFTATLKYEDGSVCTLMYTSLGAKELDKERIEIFADQKVVVMDNFKSVHTFGSKTGSVHFDKVEKGQVQELEAFSSALKLGVSDVMIDLSSLKETTEATFTIKALVKKQKGMTSKFKNEGPERC